MTGASADIRAIQAALKAPYSLDDSFGSAWAVEHYLAAHARGKNTPCPWLEGYLRDLLTRAWRELHLPVDVSTDGVLATTGYRVTLREDCERLLAPPDPLPTFRGRSWRVHPVIGIAAVPWYVLANTVLCHDWAEGDHGELSPFFPPLMRATKWLTTQGAWAIGGNDPAIYAAATKMLAQLPWPFDGFGDPTAMTRPLIRAFEAGDRALGATVLRRAAVLQDQWLSLIAARAMAELDIAAETDAQRVAVEHATEWASSSLNEKDADRLASLSSLSSLSSAGSALASAETGPSAPLKSAGAEPLEAAGDSVYATPFGRVELQEKPSVLLLDRVRMRLPKGSVVESHVKNIGGVMGFQRAMSSDHKTHCVSAGRGINAIVFETWNLADGDVDVVAKRFAEEFHAVGEVQAAAHPRVRVLVLAPTQGKLRLLAVAVVAHPDGSVIGVDIRVDATSAEENLEQCVRLAVAIAKTVEPGPRELLLGPLELDWASGSLPLPEHFTALVDRGPDFVVARLRELVPFGAGRSRSLDVYFGGHPSYHFKSGDNPIRPHSYDVTIFGAQAKVFIYTLHGRHKFEVIVAAGDKGFMHATGTAQDVKPNIELIGIVERMRRERGDGCSVGRANLDEEVAHHFAQAALLDLNEQRAKGVDPPDAVQQRGRLEKVAPELEARVVAQRKRLAAERGRVTIDRPAAERLLFSALIEGIPEAVAWVDGPDAGIEVLERRIGKQLDAIVHHPLFAQLEAFWRGVYWLATTTMRKRIRLEILNCSEDDMRMDFEDSPAINKSGLFRILYSGEFGSFGGTPYALVATDYEVGPSSMDLRPLSECAEVAALAHAPLIARASHALVTEGDAWNLDDDANMRLRPQADRWSKLRDIGTHAVLLLGGVLLREPYRLDWYREHISGPQDLLWGHGAFAVAARLADCFERTGWGLGVAGRFAPPGVSEVTPLQIVVSDERRRALAEVGIATLRASSDAESGEVADLTTLAAPDSDGRGTDISHLLVATRMAQTMKVMQREQIGTWSDPSRAERELSTWLEGYVLGGRTSGRFVSGWLPFTAASIQVRDTPDHLGFELTLTPNWAERGGAFTIDLVGKLDKR